VKSRRDDLFIEQVSPNSVFLFFGGAGQGSSKYRTLPTRAAEKQKEDGDFWAREL
jgi:hypothetical protein